jgi:glycosyltransferase involved in cell wall biosynthesis
VDLPKVSIVMPSFNQRRFIGEALRSVIAQRDQIFEFFVLDGGSTDGSPEIIEKYKGDIDYWRSAKDGGQAAAIAEGFRRGTGDVLYWINSDDVLLPGALRKVRETFAHNPQWSAITGWCVFIDEYSRIQSLRRTPRQTLRAARWGVVHVSQPTCFFRRDLYDRAGAIDTTLGGVLDTELWFRMLRHASAWGQIKQVLAAFRVHEQAKGRAWLAGYRREYLLLRRLHPEFADRSFIHSIGRAAYRAKEFLRGAYLRDWIASARLKGRTLEETFEGPGRECTSSLGKRTS